MMNPRARRRQTNRAIATDSVIMLNGLYVSFLKLFCYLSIKICIFMREILNLYFTFSRTTKYLRLY